MIPIHLRCEYCSIRNRPVQRKRMTPHRGRNPRGPATRKRTETQILRLNPSFDITTDLLNYTRLPLLLLAMAGLLAGLATGLSRMGWDVGILRASLHHGSVMVGGFLGTLIALEKVIPLKRKMLYLIPVCSGASVFVFFVGDPIYA